MAVRWGILSTADINRKLLAGAASPTRSRSSRSRAAISRAPQAYARDVGIERAYGSYEELLADPESRRSTSRSRTRCTSSGRSARSRRGSTCSARSRCRRHPADVVRGIRRGGADGPPALGGVHVAPQPADRRLAELVVSGAIGELRLDPLGLQLPAVRPRQHPPAHRRRGWRADGRRLLLRQRLAAPRRRAVEASGQQYTGPIGHRLGLHRRAALPGRRPGAVRLRDACPTATSSRRSAPRARCSSTTRGTAGRP